MKNKQTKIHPSLKQKSSGTTVVAVLRDRFSSFICRDNCLHVCIGIAFTSLLLKEIGGKAVPLGPLSTPRLTL